MTKIADTLMSQLNLKAALAVSAHAAGDLIPVYDASASAWKMSPVPDLASNAELTTAVGSVTAAELALLDLSAQSETVSAAGEVSVTKRVTSLNSAAGGAAITLAAPDATMLGQIKIIQMTTAGNAFTMALTNVVGGSQATSASFDAVNETLVLIAGKNKWVVIKEHGVTLS